MGMNSVQMYAKTLLNGLPSALYEMNLVAYLNPPNPGELIGPAAYVWAHHGDNGRQAAPRGPGFKKMTWTVNVWLMMPLISTDPNADQAFACLCDAVANAWTTAVMPFQYNDPTTGQTSQFLSVGERFTVEQSPVMSLQDQALVLQEALYQFTIEEASQN